MKSFAPLGFIAILLVSISSCSAPPDTAQTSDRAPIDSQETRLSHEDSLTDSHSQSKPERPVNMMARQLENFSEEPPRYSGDSFFETQTKFEVPSTDEISISDEFEFSDDLNIK